MSKQVEVYYMFLKGIESPLSFYADDWERINGETGKFITFSLNGITHALFIKIDSIEELYRIEHKTGERKYIIQGGKE